MSPPPPPIPSTSPSRPPTSASTPIPSPRTSTPPSQSIPPPTPSTNSSMPPSPRPPSSSTTTWHTSSRCAGSSGPRGPGAGIQPPWLRLQPRRGRRRPRSRRPLPRPPRLRMAAARPHRPHPRLRPQLQRRRIRAERPPAGQLRHRLPLGPQPPALLTHAANTGRRGPRRDRADPHPAERRKAPRLHPPGGEELRHQQPPALGRVRQAPRRKTHRPPPARPLISSRKAAPFVLPYDV